MNISVYHLLVAVRKKLVGHWVRLPLYGFSFARKAGTERPRILPFVQCIEAAITDFPLYLGP